MKRLLLLLLTLLATLAGNAGAATVNWAAGVDNGLSLADGTNLPAGTLVRIGHFRNSGTGIQLTDAQIQALSGSPSALDASFVEAGATMIGSGFSPAIAGHFAAGGSADAGAAGLNVEGRQIYLWVLNAPTVAAATQHGIFYWDIGDTGTNPDGSPEAPGTRWSFPVQDPPGSTTIDLTDLTTNTNLLAAGARVVVGIFPSGISSSTGAPTFSLSPITTTVVTGTPLPGGVLGAGYSQTLAAGGGTPPYSWALNAGTLPGGLSLDGAGLLSGAPTTAGVFSFTVQATDSAGAGATKQLSVTIASTALGIATVSPLTSGTRGLAYSAQLSASGGTQPYTWSLNGGALPQEISMDGAGALGGTPPAAGVFNFTVQVADGGGLFATKAFSITIVSIADTAGASAITSGWATLNGTANPNGKPTAAYFQYGLATGYGSNTFSVNLGSGTASVPVSFNVAGLSRGTTYHYRLVVTNADGTFHGADQTFTTPSAVSAPAWHSGQVTAAGNMAAGARTGAAHTGANLYFYKGTDNNIWAVYSDGTQWRQSQLTTAANVDDWLAFHPAYSLLYYKGTDNNVWACYWTGSQWSQTRLTASGNVAGDLVVDGTWNFAYYRGLDSRIWALWLSGTTGWTEGSLGGTGNVAGSVSVDSAWHLIYYRGTDSQMWCHYYPGTGNWAQVRLTATANVGGGVTADTAGLVYYSSSADGRMWGVFWNGSAWAQSLLSSAVIVSGNPAIYAQHLPVYLNPAGQCAVMHVSGSIWATTLLGDGGSGLTGGLGVLRTTYWVFSRRNDGNVIVFYYQ